MGRYIYGVMDGGDMERFPLDGVVQFAAQKQETPAPWKAPPIANRHIR